MSNQVLDRISPHAIELGPIGFSLYTPGPGGSMVLFCRAGFEITARHKQILKDLDRSFFIASSDRENYVEYTLKRLPEIISNPDIRVTEKASILHGVGVRSAKRILQDPDNKENFKNSEEVVSNYLDLILGSPDAAGALFALSAADPFTLSHSVNVATLNILLGDVIYSGDRDKLRELGIAGLMHDIGKTRIDEKILLKKTPLTTAEFEEIKRHTVYGEEIIRSQGYDEAISLVARQHHEWAAGSGYPDRLTAGNISDYARITAVCDVYDALTTKKTYRDKQPQFKALQEMAKEKGHFDADIFDVLLHVVLRNKDLISYFRRTHLTDRDRLTKEYGVKVLDVSELSDVEIL